MVERRVCTFCGDEIEPGTGRMYIKKDGIVYNFCSSKCFKNMVVLGRVPRRTTWTRYYEREKQVRMKGQPEATQPAKARKLKKAGEEPGPEPAKPEEAAARGEQEKPAEKKESDRPSPAKKEAKKSAPKKPEGEDKKRAEAKQKEAAKV